MRPSSGAPGPGASHAVTLTVTAVGGQPGDLQWVAFADGDGAWQPATARGLGNYGWEPVSDRYSVAYVCRNTLQNTVEIVAATIAELPAIDVTCGLPPADRIAWTGKVSGTSPGSQIVVTLGSPESLQMVAMVDSTGSYTAMVPPSTYDIVAAAGSAPGASAIVIKRGIEIAAPGSTDFDFGNAIVVKTASQPTAANPMNDEQVGVHLYGYTRNGAIIPLPLPLNAPAGEIGFVDVKALAPGDMQNLTVDGSRANGQLMRGTTITLQGEPPNSIALPPVWDDVQLGESDATAASRPKVSFTPYPKVLFYRMLVSGLERGHPDWIMSVGAGWLGSRTSFELADLSAAPGFDAAWGPPPAGMRVVEAAAITSSRGMGPVLHDQFSPRGAARTYARRIW
jgi:hypothetical protein